jgi:hypothetical protein
MGTGTKDNFEVWQHRFYKCNKTLEKVGEMKRFGGRRQRT